MSSGLKTFCTNCLLPIFGVSSKLPFSRLTIGRLAAVNFFLGCVGLTQVTRIMLHRSSQKGSLEQAVKDEAGGVKDATVGAVKEAEGAVKSKL